MATWHEITRDPEYQELTPEAKSLVKKGFFDRVIAADPDYQTFTEDTQKAIFDDFWQTPDDTGQGYVTSMLGAAGRGFGEMVPGAIEGVGALTGSEGLREFGQDVRGGLEAISPVNPIYAESVPVKLAGVGGQVGSMLATAGAGGLAGKALGGVGAATTGMRAAPLASAFLQGSAEGAREAERYGMTGPEAYLRTLAGGATEAGTELLPFGMAAETALARRLLTGVPRTGTFLGAVGSEAGEEGLGQIASNIATKALAPAGVETPDITEGALEAAAYGAAGGAMIGGVNALISTPPERQTQIQKDRQAEFGDIPKDTVPDQTNEEKIAAMESGGTTVVDPDGKTAVIPPAVAPEEQPSMPLPDEIVIAEENLKATQNVPFTDITDQAATNIVQENARIASQLAVSTEQATEKVGAEVTPPSEGAERNRAIIAEAAAKLRGEAPQDISAGLQAAIPQQPVETQEDATRKITLEESVYEEPQDRIESREAEEAGVGDQLLRPATGEVKEEVMPSPEVAADPFAAAPLVDNLPALIAVRDNNATPEQVQSLVDQGLVKQVDGKNIITEAGVAAMPEDQRPKLTPAERRAEVEGMAVPVVEAPTKAQPKPSEAIIELTELPMYFLRNPQQKKLWNVDELYAEPARISQSVSDKIGPQGTAFTVEQLMNQIAMLRDFVSSMNGRLLRGGDKGTSAKELAENWTTLRGFEALAIDYAAKNPQEWQNYRNRQNELLGLESGADVIAPYPSPDIAPIGKIGKLDKKFSKNWRVIFPNGETALFHPTALRAVSSTIETIGADVIEELTPFTQAQKAIVDKLPELEARDAQRKGLGFDYPRAKIGRIPGDQNVYISRLDQKNVGVLLPDGSIKMLSPEDSLAIQSKINDFEKRQAAQMEKRMAVLREEAKKQSESKLYQLTPSGPIVRRLDGKWINNSTGKPLGRSKNDQRLLSQLENNPNIEFYQVVAQSTDGGVSFVPVNRVAQPTNQPFATEPTAAETQTPVPLREGTGAAGVVQSEPVEGSIPTVGKVSTETESASTEKSPVTKPSEVTLNIAKRFGGRIAWSQGDLAIVEAFQLFGSKSLYIAVVGDRYSMTDFTLMKPEQRKALLGDNEELFLRKREEIIESNNRMLDENPDGPFTNGQTIVVSKNVPQNVASVFREWVRLLGLSAPTRIVLTTPQDGIDMAAQYGGKFRRIGVTSLMSDNERGQMTPLGGDDFHIFYKKDASYARTLETLAHELGHILERQAFKNLPEDQRKAIIVEHEKWLKRVGPQKVLDGIRELRAMRVGRIQPNVDRADERFEELNAYWKSFSEWFADQVSRWATTTEKPLTVVEKFFARLGKKLREFFNLKGDQFAPNQKVAEWLDSLSPDLNSVIEATFAKAETETASSGKMAIADAAVRDLEDSISKLPEKAQAKWTPEVMGKARDFYASDDRSQSRLDGLTQIQKNKVYDSLYRADKAAAAEQDRIEKAQRARDKEIEKEEREAAKKEAEMLKREEMRSKAIDSLIGASEKKKRKFGQVTNSDAIAAVAMLVSSKDVPGVLTTWVGTKEDFLRDPANQLADPEIYARIKAGELVEGFFNKGRAYVFLDGVGVSENDMLRGEQMDVSPQIAAVRRVLLHESLVHRGIHGLPLRHRRLILNWVRQNSTPEELDDLAKLYTEYANWRDSEFQFEALAEELLAKKVDSLTEIPKDGPMAKLMDILRQIWDFIVGYKREPTLSDLKSVVKLLKSGAEALTNDTLKDGGQVKLSMIAPTAGITPEMDAEYLEAVAAGDMEKAQRMVDEAAKAAGYNMGPVWHGSPNKDFTTFDRSKIGTTTVLPYNAPKGFYFAKDEKLTARYGPNKIRAFVRGPFMLNNTKIVVVESPNQIKSADPVTRDDAGNVIPLSQRFQTTSPDIRFSRPQFSSDTSAAFSAGSEAARSTLYSERDMDIREAIRRAYEAMPKQNSVAVPIGELFAKTEELMPGVTQDEFSNVLQDLFEDNGAVLQEGESDFFVTTPEGRRAGFVVVMPRAAKASRIKADDAAATRLKEDIAAIENGSFKSKFGGVQFTDFPASERTVKPKEFYSDAAIRFVDDLQDKGNSIEDIAFSIQSPDFLEAIGIENNLSAQDALTIEVRNRVNNELRREKKPDRKKRLDKMNKRLSGYWQGTGSKAGANLGIRKHLINDPRYRWMFIKDLAEKGIAESVENVARSNMDSPEDFTNKANAEGEKASEQATQAVADETEAAVEDDLDAQLLREGEALLDTERRKIWDRIKDILRKLAIIARARSKRVPNAAKASISKAESDAIFKMSDDELAKLEKELLGEFDRLAKAFLGEESTADTPAKKTTRAKRKAMVDTAKKRAESGKEISPEAKEAAAIEMAENKASQIIYRFEELYRQGFKNPPEGMSKKEQKDSIIKAFRDQVKNPTSFEAFAERLANLKVGEEVAERMFLTASRERADLIRVKDFKIAKRKVEIADKQASRLIYSTEERFRQGSKDLETSKDGDSINKAFRDQVSTPVSEADFSKRLAKLNVSPDVAARLFKTAAREKADLEVMEAFRLLEGPDALKNILREIERMRRGEEIPLRTPIPWRKLLSQKAKTVAEYRQRIFDAISSNEAFQNLTDDKKAKLADLFSEAWESKRKDILERMLTTLINKEEAAKRISKDGAKALREQRMKLVEDINLGILDAEEVMKRLAEKFGIKTEFTEEERQKIDSLIETIQDETLNRVKRNKAAYELLKTLSGNAKIPIVKMLADYWVASVLSGMNTATSIALAVGNGAFELLSGVYRVLTAGVMNPKDVPAEITASFKAMAAFLKAFKREGRLAWQYLVTGDREFLDPSMNDVLNDLNYESIGRSTALAEKMAESDKIAQKVMGVWMRSVSRLLTALDSFNAGVTKAGSLPIVSRQLGLNPEGIAKVEEAMNLQNYKDIIIQRDFAGIPPKTQREKAILDSWAKDEMMAELDKYGKFSENANFYGQQGAMTLEPSGLGGFIYRSIKSLTGAATTGADKFLAESQRKWKQADNANKAFQALQLGLAYFLQFGAYNSANLAGLRFARFAGNKFNQGLSFLPGIGMLRLYESRLDKTHIDAEEAFTDMILRNQLAGFIISLGGVAILKAISDEPDDEKRGWFINGSWANLTPEKKQQKLAAGQKEFTFGFGDKVFSYQNWPISSALAAIGGLSDLIRFSPEKWKEKGSIGVLTSAATSGVFSATEIPALSGFQTLFGNNLSSKDPNEKRLDRFANVMAGWGGGFVPRILKDFDYLAEPELRKYETLWERTASHIPIYRRYVGDEYYDILGKQIEKKVYPGSREFMEKPSDPEYQILGKLNSRGIWLTPANAEYRMVGKGRNRRRLTQEEADAYSLETGKGYRQMLLRYGQRALQMPTERARAFLSDKADEVRDRALKKVYRGYTK